MKSNLSRERVENELSGVGGLFQRIDHVPVRRDQLHLPHLLLPDLVVRVRYEVLPHLRKRSYISITEMRLLSPKLSITDPLHYAVISMKRCQFNRDLGQFLTKGHWALIISDKIFGFQSLCTFTFKIYLGTGLCFLQFSWVLIIWDKTSMHYENEIWRTSWTQFLKADSKYFWWSSRWKIFGKYLHCY